MWIPTNVPAKLSMDGLATSENTARSRPILSALDFFRLVGITHGPRRSSNGALEAGNS